MKYYSPTGRRNRGRPLKRLLDTWDRNGSTTPWQIYDDDDVFYVSKVILRSKFICIYSDSLTDTVATECWVFHVIAGCTRSSLSDLIQSAWRYWVKPPGSRNYLYCCTVHFKDSLNITHRSPHISMHWKQRTHKYMICHITHNNGILIILLRDFS